jgi:hypothetical protein
VCEYAHVEPALRECVSLDYRSSFSRFNTVQ